MPKESPYDDDVSKDEEAELDKLMRSNEVPEPDEKPGASTDDVGDDEPGDEGDDEGQPKPKPGEGEGEGGEGDEGKPGDENAELAAFLEKHKGKTPEQLAELAFQQQKRAARSEFDSRKATDNLKSVLDRIEAAKAAKLEKIAAKRTDAEKKIAEDPDAALAELRREQLEAEEAEANREAEDAEFEARAQAAVELAAAAIPDFATRAPAIRAFGSEMGYTPEEVNGIVDGRQIVTLYLASIAGNMIKSGLIDTGGRFLKLPEPAADPDEGKGGKRGGQRPNFRNTPARGAGQQKSLEQRLADVATMSDEDFDKLDPAALEAMLRDAELAEG